MPSYIPFSHIIRWVDAEYDDDDLAKIPIQWIPTAARFSIGKSSTNGSFFQSCYSYVSLLKGAILDAFNGSKPLLPTTWKWPRYASADAEEAGRWLLRSGEATGRHRTHLHLGIQQVGGPQGWRTCTLRKMMGPWSFFLDDFHKKQTQADFPVRKVWNCHRVSRKISLNTAGKNPSPTLWWGLKSTGNRVRVGKNISRFHQRRFPVRSDLSLGIS